MSSIIHGRQIQNDNSFNVINEVQNLLNNTAISILVS